MLQHGWGPWCWQADEKSMTMYLALLRRAIETDLEARQVRPLSRQTRAVPALLNSISNDRC